MDLFPGRVVVDERFGQPFGNVRRKRKITEPKGYRQRQGSAAIQSHPGAAPANLIARAVNKDALWRKTRADCFPDQVDIGLVILAQHVEGSHHAGPAGDGDFKTAYAKVQPVVLERLGDADPLRLDFDAGDMRGWTDGVDARIQFNGRGGGAAVTQINHERVAFAPQPPCLRPGQPAVHAAQSIRVGGAAGGIAKRLAAMPCHTL